VSRLEDRLADALRGPAQAPRPSPDLFARVMDSVEHDRRRRRRIRLAAAAGVALVLAAAALATFLINRTRNGETEMPWWTLEILINLILVAIALWLGPFIKRFGRAYAADVFHDNPLTGKSYIVLTDIVYYLIFAAYILFTIRVQRDPDWAGENGVAAPQVAQSLMRIGGILLVIGILHGLNIVLMPILGRLFSLNRRLPNHLLPERDPDRL
jgi:phosphate starvation-inducible membrane PsiE